MKPKVLEVLQPFMSFLDGFQKKRGHNMLVLMFNLRFKSLQLVTNYIGHNKTSALVVQYDVGLLLFLLIQCYKILMGHMCLVNRFTWRAQIPSVKIFFKPRKLVQKLWLHLCHKSLMDFVITNMDNCKCALS